MSADYTLSELKFTPVVDNDTKTISGNVECIFNNYFGLQDGTVYVSVGCTGEDGNIVNVCQNPLEINLEDLQEKIVNFAVSFSYEENKRYKLSLIESKDKVNWVSCINTVKTTAIYVQVVNGEAILSTPQVELTATVSIDGNSDDGYVGMHNPMKITLTNNGDTEYYNQVFIMVSESETISEYATFTRCATVPIGGSQTLNINYIPQAAGTYHFWIFDADDFFVPGKKIGQNILTFKEVSESPDISLVSIKCTNASEDKIYADFESMNKVYDTKAEFVFEVKNDGGFYQGIFLLTESKNGGSINETYRHFQTLKFPAHSTIYIPLTVEGNIGDVVSASMQGYDWATANDIIRDENNIDIFYEKCYLAGPQTHINDIEISGTKPVDVYNLSGVKVYSGILGNTSLEKGLYIVRQGNTVKKITISK